MCRVLVSHSKANIGDAKNQSATSHSEQVLPGMGTKKRSTLIKYLQVDWPCVSADTMKTRRRDPSVTPIVLDCQRE